MTKLITLGSPTSTGGKVITASSGMKINGKKVARLGDIATCTCGRNSCLKQGAIYRKGIRKISIDGTELARSGDLVNTGCNSCYLLEPADVVCVGESNGSEIILGGNGRGINFGDGVFMQGATSAGAQSSSLNTQSNSLVNDPYRSEPPLYSQTQTAEKILSDSLALECSLEEELAKNHQQVLVTDLEDAHKILHNLWLEIGKDIAVIAASINNAKSWFNHTEPMFDAISIAKQFGDMNIKVDLVESKGKTFVAFNGINKDGNALKYAFVNGTRINMGGKKYPLNSFKSVQAGFSPQSRAVNFKGAALLTFVVSASIATSDLIFKDDYHLVNWFGNVGADMFKALLQYGAGEAALFAAATYSVPIVLVGVAVFVTYALIEVAWSQYDISQKIVTELENATTD